MINPKIQRQTAFWEKRSPALFLHLIHFITHFYCIFLISVNFSEANFVHKTFRKTLPLKSYIQTVIYFAVFSMVKVSSIASTLPSSVI